MILDCFATCGMSPQEGRVWSLIDLAYWADLSGIDVLLVNSTEARVRVNDEPLDALLDACQGSDQFLPVATIGLESDRHSLHVARTARSRGFAGVLLHGTLFEGSRIVHGVLAALCDAPLPIYRQVEYEELDLVYRIARQFPVLAFIIVPAGFQALELNHRLVELPNVYLSLAHTCYSLGQVETACRVMGAERILFAGDLPQQHPARPIGAIVDAEISEAERALILGRNALRLLAEHGITIEDRASRPFPIPPCPIIDTHGHIGSDLNSIGLRWTLFPLLCSGLPERTLRLILCENAVRFFGFV